MKFDVTEFRAFIEELDTLEQTANGFGRLESAVLTVQLDNSTYKATYDGRRWNLEPVKARKES